MKITSNTEQSQCFCWWQHSILCVITY